MSLPPAIPPPLPTSPDGRIARRHDLDALRAIAMLLGIVLHAGLSFFPFPWPVQDTRQAESLGLLFSAIHGFRMPLFFLVSGFFTAMLWRKRGLRRLLHHRFKRIFLPFLLGLVTIVPIGMACAGFVMTRGQGIDPNSGPDWLQALRADDAQAMRDLVAGGWDVNEMDPATGIPAINWAALLGRADSVGILLEAGADPNARDRNRNTPLHSAAFLGFADVTRQLLEAGADPSLAGGDGKTPVDSAHAPWEMTKWVAGLLSLEIDRGTVEAGRKEVLPLLHGTENADGSGEGWYRSLTRGEYFMHLWFLAFLCWLVLLFAVYAWLMDRLGVLRIPTWLVRAPGCLLWVLPLTLMPQLHMEWPGAFGPDTSAALLPRQHVLWYYAVFFFFGALYFDGDDAEGRLGRWWPLWLAGALALFLPGLDFLYGGMGIRETLGIPAESYPLAGAVTQVLYVWFMIFAWVGFFRAVFARESKVMRYVSDSSYWLYLAHLPLVFLFQHLVREWPLPALVKFAFITVALSTLLLLSYEHLVRYRWLGTFLNGPRSRPVHQGPQVTAPSRFSENQTT